MRDDDIRIGNERIKLIKRDSKEFKNIVGNEGDEGDLRRDRFGWMMKWEESREEIEYGKVIGIEEGKRKDLDDLLMWRIKEGGLSIKKKEKERKGDYVGIGKDWRRVEKM